MPPVRSDAREPSSEIRLLEWAALVSEVGRNEAGCAPAIQPPDAEQLKALPQNVMRQYLDRLLLGRHPDEGLDALLEIGVLAIWLPEIAAMVGFGDGEWRHKDVWKHTKQVVWQSVRRLEVRWGALLHDIGKIATRTIDEKGNVHFFGHSEVGASMFRKRVARRFGFDGFLYQRIHFLILHHLRASQYDGSWTDAAVRRFTRQMGEGLDDLLALSRADITTKRPEKRKQGLRQISALARRIEALAEADAANVPSLPKGLGTAIMTEFQLPPSKHIGDIKLWVQEAVDRHELEGGQKSEYYVAWLRRAHPELS